MIMGRVAPPALGDWITLAEAERRGILLHDVADAIGPRRVGTVYRSGYWGDVNTVLAVWVRLSEHNPMRANWWHVAEYSGTDTYIRHHMTSWEYDSGNVVLFGPADMRPAFKR